MPALAAAQAVDSEDPSGPGSKVQHLARCPAPCSGLYAQAEVSRPLLKPVIHSNENRHLDLV